MRKTLTRTGNSLALVLDKPLLEQLGIGPETELELSTDGTVIVISKVSDQKRDERLKRVMQRIDSQYAGVFKKLAE